MKTPQFKQKEGTNFMKTAGLLGFLCLVGVVAGVLVLPEVERVAFVPAPIKSVIVTAATSSKPNFVLTPTTTPTTTRTTTPITTPVVKPATPKPVAAGVGFSVGQSLLGVSSATRNARLDDMASLGATWLRFDIEWSDVQPKDSKTFDWARTDALLAAANARHINVLPILVYAPRWARSDSCADSVRCAPKDPAQFAAFAAAVAARYAPLGVHNWEIWNEENLGASWLPHADAAQYAAFLKASYDSVKKVDPEANIIVGGMGPAATRDTDIAPIEYLGALYTAGAKNSFDGVGFHPYSFPANPGYVMSWNAWQQMANTNPSLRSVMVKNGDADKKIWITEYGTPTGGPGGMSEEAQGAMISEAVKLWHSYSWAGPLLLYTYKDMGTDQSTKENFFGLLRYDGTQKPAYEALKSLLKTF